VVIEAFALLVPVRQLQTLFAPDPFDFLVVYTPALGAKQFTDLAVPVPTILLGQPDQRQAQFILVPG